MKKIFFVIISLAMMNGYCFGYDNIEIKNQNDKDSYSLGYQYGDILKKQDWKIDPGIFSRGVSDGFRSKDPLLKAEEMKESLLSIRKRIAATQQRKFQEESIKNYHEGKTFLDKNGKKEGVQTLKSGLQYKILADGMGRKPESGDIVTVHYRGTFIDGTEFDSSYARGKSETVQMNSLIQGCGEALHLMKEGSKWQLFIPPELAYGQSGQGSRIPPNSTLIFEIELIRIEDAGNKNSKLRQNY
ncbi:MAG: FKBP-type peptidyl-prolyl cis-trans isomerase [Smithella sp.]